PVNQRTPFRSKVAVLRFAAARSGGSGNRWTSLVTGSTRTIASRPPSVIQGAPSGPTMTPCGADPEPSGISRTSPVAGSRCPSVPLPCPVNQMPPSAAGATSCGRVPAGTGNSTIVNVAGFVLGGAAGETVDPAESGAADDAETVVAGVGDGGDPHAATQSAALTPR